MSDMAQLSDNDSTKAFIPSPTFQGAKQGYYFGTNDQGTGYYVDLYQQSKVTSRKRTVRIEEDQNEMRLLPVSLLKEAEMKASGATIVELTPKGIHAASNALRKIFNQNAMQRAKFADEAHQYMDSELALYEHLQSLLAVAANPMLYSHVLNNEALMVTLSELLSHDNTDICAVVITIFLEWLDPSLLKEKENDAIAHVVQELGAKVLTNSFDTIVANLDRFQANRGNEEDTEDETLDGLENSLSLIENLLELDLMSPQGLLRTESDMSVPEFIAKRSTLVPWVLTQINRHETEDELKGRSVELLASLVQSEDIFLAIPDWSNVSPVPPPNGKDDDDIPDPKRRKKGEPIDGIEIMLQELGAFRKRQPKDNQELELLENICVVLSACISFSAINLRAFLNGQGIELVLRCLKEQVHAGGSALKLLDFFGTDTVFKEACEHLVKAGGIKYLFPVFLGTRMPKLASFQPMSRKDTREWTHALQSNVVRVLYSMSWHLDEKSPEDAKSRFLSKFVDDERKCDRLVELLLLYDQKMQSAEYDFYRSNDSTESDIGQLAVINVKLAGGGEIFYRLAAIAALVCLNSKVCHERILSQLYLRQSGSTLLKAGLKEFLMVLEDGSQRDHIVFLFERI